MEIQTKKTGRKFGGDCVEELRRRQVVLPTRAYSPQAKVRKVAPLSGTAETPPSQHSSRALGFGSCKFFF